MVDEVEVSDWIEELKKSPNWEQRKMAKMIEVEELIRRLKSPDWEVRRYCAERLGRVNIEMVDNEIVIEPLIKALKDEDWRVRKYAVMSLGNLGYRKSAEVIIEALKDESWRVRAEAIIVILKFDKTDKTKTGILTKMLKDNSNEVRETTAWALGWLGDTKAVPALIEALEDKDPQVRMCVIGALGRIRDKKGIDAITKLKEKAPEVRECIKEALNRDEKEKIGE